MRGRRSSAQLTDDVRARRLAIAAAIAITCLLYLLGGLSLYLRAHTPQGLDSVAGASTPKVDALPSSSPATLDTSAAPAQPEPVATLVPTITPHPGFAALWVVSALRQATGSQAALAPAPLGE